MNLIKLSLIVFITSFGFIVKSQTWNMGKNISLENNDSFEGFEILDSLVNQNRLFLVGEDHYYSLKNISLETKMFRYLLKKHGVNHLMLEFGYSFQQLLNIYLNSNENVELDGFDRYKDIDLIHYFKNLKSLYQKGEGEKFKVHGIDIERFYSFPVIYLNYLLPKDTMIPSEIIVSVETLIKFNTYLDNDNSSNEIAAKEPDYKPTDYIDKYKTMCLIISDFDSLAPYFKDYLGENFNEFKKVILSIKDMIYYKSLEQTPKQKIFRDQYIFNKFETIANSFENDKFYGQFGYCHSCNFNSSKNEYQFDLTSFIKKVKESKNFNKPVGTVSMVIAYYNPNLKKSYQGEFGSFVNATSKNKNAIYPLYKEQSLKMLKKKHEFVIVVKENIKEIKVNNLHPNFKNKSWPSMTYAKLISPSATYGQYNLNLSNLNSALPKSNFKSPIQGFGFNYLLNSKDGTGSGGFSFLFFNKQKTAINSDTNFSLDGYNIAVQLGYDVLQFSNKVALIPMLGINFQQLKLSPILSNVPNNFPFNSKSAVSVYKNPAFICTPQIELNVVLFEWLGLGAKIGYGFDFSNKKWKLNGTRQASNANVDQSGYFFETKLSMVIID